MHAAQAASPAARNPVSRIATHTRWGRLAGRRDAAGGLYRRIRERAASLANPLRCCHRGCFRHVFVEPTSVTRDDPYFNVEGRAVNLPTRSRSAGADRGAAHAICVESCLFPCRAGCGGAGVSGRPSMRAPSRNTSVAFVRVWSWITGWDCSARRIMWSATFFPAEDAPVPSPERGNPMGIARILLPGCSRPLVTRLALE